MELKSDYVLNKKYIWYNNSFSTNEINEFIYNLNWYFFDIALIQQIAGYDKEGRFGCGNNEFLEYTFMTYEDYRSLINKDISLIRERICTFLKTNKKTVDIYIGKCLTKAINTIIKELKSIGLSVQVTDYWKHIDDDFSVIELVISCV